MFWEGLPKAAQGLVFDGLIHACDWLPTAVSAMGLKPVAAGETLPLDGIDMWSALLSNATSPRTVVYYGINQGSQGPAIRDVAGYKLMLVDTNGGGGKGEWSLQQLPNASSSTQELLVDTQSYAVAGMEQMIGSGADACHIQTGVCYPGGDLVKLVLGTIAECCATCAGNDGAVGFTFRKNPPGQPSCFLKHTLGKADSSGCTSGYKNGSHPLPPAPPPPLPGPPLPEGHLLYNVIDDAGEHTPLDATTPEHAAIVKKLQAVVDTYAKTKVPQATGDPACPPFSGISKRAGELLCRVRFQGRF